MNAGALLARLDEADLTRSWGRVRKLAGDTIEADGPSATLGSLCWIERGSQSRPPMLAEIVAVDNDRIRLLPLAEPEGVALGARVSLSSRSDTVSVGDAFSGRAIDALGGPIDGGPPTSGAHRASLREAVPRPLDRADAVQPIATGIRAIDALLTLARGQRVGIFAASGVGKTSMVEQLASQIDCDHCILCLVGERGREVEQLWRSLAAERDQKRFTLVAATSDQSAVLRVRAVDYASALADHWRRAGRHVVLIVDSVTRLAMALREIGLAAGAPPTVRAYTPNIFTALPRLVEQCGALRSGGAVTGIMTILSETDDVDDPIAELMKSLLDGHILLSRTLAEQAHFPAIDVARSLSRGADRMIAPEHLAAARQATAMLSGYEEARIMIESGVYKSGSNLLVDKAIARRPDLMRFLQQGRDERTDPDESVRRLQALIGSSNA